MTKLIEHLMRGGAFGHYWTKQTKETFWWPTRAGVPPVPSGWERQDVYFGVHPSTVQKGAAERTKWRDIAAINCLYAEFDAKDFGGSKRAAAEHIKTLNPRPSIIHDSGGGYHCFWLLDEPFILDIPEKRQRVKDLQKRWVKFVDGDPVVCDLARVLRIPGTYNYKYKPPRKVEVKVETYNEYSLQDLGELLGPPVELDLNQDSDAVVPVGERNLDLTSLAGALRRKGVLEDVILQALWVQTTKHHEEPLELEEVQRIVKSAMSWDPESLLLTQPANHEGHAQCFKYLFGENYLHCDEAGWLRYNGKFWEMERVRLERDVVRTLTRRRLASATCEDSKKAKAIFNSASQRAANVTGTIRLLESILPVKWEEFDASPDLLNCANGVLDLRTGGITPHVRSQRFTYCLDTAYNQAADAGEWEQFLSEVVDVQDKQGALEYLQLAMGYTITGHTREEILFYLVGPTRSGKGTFAETIKTLLGKLAWEMAFDAFSSDRKGGSQNFDLAPLRDCRFLAASEGARKTWLKATFLKRITGGNSVFTAFKYKTPFNYRPRFKIWLSSNFEPKTDPTDDGAWGRIRVIRFPNSFFGHEDKLLKARLQLRGNLEGLLAWLVVGAQRWYELGAQGLKTPPFVQKAVLKARGAVDYVLEWADEHLEDTEDEGDVISSARYYDSYKRWVKSIGGEPRGRRTLTHDLRRLGYHLTEGDNEKAYDKVLGKWGRGLVGYRIVDTTGAEEMLRLSSDLSDI